MTAKNGIAKKRWVLWSSPVGRREFINGHAFCGLWTIGLILFVLYPIVSSFYLSFTDSGILGESRWIGLANFVGLFSDSLFITCVYNTIYLAALLIPAVLILQLGLALLLNTKGLRGLAIYRTIFFVPSVVPAIASAFIFLWMLDTQFGPVNQLLSFVGLPRLTWLNSVVWSKPAHLLINTWIGVGTGMVIFLAALRTYPNISTNLPKLTAPTPGRRPGISPCP